MMKVIFRNVESSEITRATVEDRLLPIVEKFPYLREHRVRATVSMENSPAHPGRDQFTLKVRISGPRVRSLILEKSDVHLHTALAEVADHLLEALNRAGDRERVVRRRRDRRPTGALDLGTGT